MSSRQLDKKPLVEAIFEVRWELLHPSPGIDHDPHYKLLLGRFYDRIRADYPEHEQLATASFPDEIVGHAVQHRFRVSKDGWPLIQIGPGIVTVNSTADYTWEDFLPRAVAVVNKVFDAHPKTDELQASLLALRYINAVDFDYLNHDAFAFLREKLKVNLTLPVNLFEDPRVTSCPRSFLWHSAFTCSSPRAVVNIKFATGQRNKNQAIVWETMVQAAPPDIPSLPGGIQNWLTAAHDITSDWFFKLIAGDLERSFDNA